MIKYIYSLAKVGDAFSMFALGSILFIFVTGELEGVPSWRFNFCAGF